MRVAAVAWAVAVFATGALAIWVLTLVPPSNAFEESAPTAYWITVLIGTAALFYLVPLVHLACAALGPAYAWRFNRVGARSPLLPS